LERKEEGITRGRRNEKKWGKKQRVRAFSLWLLERKGVIGWGKGGWARRGEGNRILPIPQMIGRREEGDLGGGGEVKCS